MELQEAIDKFKKDLAHVKAGGATQVEINALDGYLDTLLAGASTSVELRRLTHESNLAHYNAKIAHSLENFRVVMQAGKEAINAAIIINGGAIIALMSFLANAIGKPGRVNYLMAFSYPLFLLGCGVFFGGVAFGTRYISQFLYADLENVRTRKAGHCFNALSWILTISSFLSFAVAVFACYTSLLAS